MARNLNALAAAAEQFGMPSFDEFCKNYHYYMKQWKMHKEAVIETVENGPQSEELRKLEGERIFHFGVYKSHSHMEIVKIIEDVTAGNRNVDFRIVSEVTTAGKRINHVHYFLKESNESNQGRDGRATDGAT